VGRIRELYGGYDHGDANINDASTFDAVPVPEDEPVAECVVIVNRYLQYLTAREQYNRRTILSPSPREPTWSNWG